MIANRFLGGILLIAGTCIGAGMLALPMIMASSGFWLANLLLVIVWFLTYVSGLYVLEANLALPEGANFISMAKGTLGNWGEAIAWLTYLLLLYSLMAAYLSAGGDIVHDGIQSLLATRIKDWVGPLPWVVGISMVVYAGARFVDGINRVFVFGLIVTYVLLVFISAPHTKEQLLQHVEWGHYLPALPIVVTAFGYHVIIPVLRRYLHGDVKKLSRMILMGSALPLVVYIIWNLVVFGTVAVDGQQGLTAIASGEHPTIALTNAMAALTQSQALASIAEGFIFFAIASSFLGIAYSLFDFLRDGILAHHGHLGRIAVLMTTFLPPLLFAILFPKGFILALSYAGVFVAVLHGILPVMMVYAARRKGMVKDYQVPSGLLGLVLVFAASILVIITQFLYK